MAPDRVRDDEPFVRCRTRRVKRFDPVGVYFDVALGCKPVHQGTRPGFWRAGEGPVGAAAGFTGGLALLGRRAAVGPAEKGAGAAGGGVCTWAMGLAAIGMGSFWLLGFQAAYGTSNTNWRC